MTRPKSAAQNHILSKAKLQMKKEAPSQQYGLYNSPFGELKLFWSALGLTRLLLPEGPCVEQSLLLSTSGEPAELPKEWTRYLDAYFQGEQPRFAWPLHFKGTDFQKRAWEQIRLIPYGETITYGELARRCGSPQGSRAAGRASGDNPLPIVIPCHRVLAVDGSLHGFGGGLYLKRKLLELEGAWPVGPQPLPLFEES